VRRCATLKHDIGGSEIFTDVEMMQKYAEARGLAKRVIVRVPVLTPMLSAYWVDLVTPISSGIALICHDSRIDQYVPIIKTPFKDAC
jgi:hypothetical protein